MNDELRNVFEQAQRLSVDERWRLVAELIRLDNIESPQSEWVRIAEQRDEALDADPTLGIDGDEILAKLEKGECP